jgi:hypothetical protein
MHLDRRVRGKVRRTKAVAEVLQHCGRLGLKDYLHAMGPLNAVDDGWPLDRGRLS